MKKLLLLMILVLALVFVFAGCAVREIEEPNDTVEVTDPITPGLDDEAQSESI